MAVIEGQYLRGYQVFNSGLDTLIPNCPEDKLRAAPWRLHRNLFETTLPSTLLQTIRLPVRGLIPSPHRTGPTKNFPAPNDNSTAV